MAEGVNKTLFLLLLSIAVPAPPLEEELRLIDEIVTFPPFKLLAGSLISTSNSIWPCPLIAVKLSDKTSNVPTLTTTLAVPVPPASSVAVY